MVLKEKWAYCSGSEPIGQIIYGWYGTISAEAMAMGTPVVCYIREDLEEFGKDLPIFRANKINLVKNLESLIQNLKLRKELSLKGRKYVSKVHDAPQIAKQILNIYTN